MLDPLFISSPFLFKERIPYLENDFLPSYYFYEGHRYNIRLKKTSISAIIKMILQLTIYVTAHGKVTCYGQGGGEENIPKIKHEYCTNLDYSEEESFLK